MFSKLKGENMQDERRRDLQRIRGVADYQFGKGVGEKLFPDNVEIVYSGRTGRIRQVYFGGESLATLRARDGLFSLTIRGAKKLWEEMEPRRCWVKVLGEVAPFIAQGKSVFAKHVMDADEEIRPQEEVIVINEEGEVTAVGKAVLTGREMTAFKRGVAVKVRRGVSEKLSENPKILYGGI